MEFPKVKLPLYNKPKKITKYVGDTETLVVSPTKQPTNEVSLLSEEDNKYYNHYKQWITNNIEPKHCLEFTVTFAPYWQAHGLEYQRMVVKKYLQKILKEKDKDVRIILLYEISQLGNFHYHGLITRAKNTTIQEIKKIFQRYIGRVELKQVQYWDSYIDYMTKRYSTEYKLYDKIDNFLDILLKPKDVLNLKF